MRLHRLPALLLAASLSVSGVLTTAACGSGTAHATVGATVSVPATAHALASRAAGPASSSTRRTSSTPAIASGRTFLVNSKADAADMAAVRAAITKAGGGFVTSWPQIGVTVGVAAVGKAQAVVKTLRKDAHVQSVGATGTLVAREKNRAPISTAKKSTLKEQDLITKAAQSPSANKVAIGKGVTIGIADTGVLEESNELAGRVDTKRSGSCTIGGVFHAGQEQWRPSTTAAAATHGTTVAAVAAGAADGVGVRGVAPKATIVAIRVVNEEGDIHPEASVCAVMTAAAEGVPILNHSYGLENPDGVPGLITTRHTFYDPAVPDQAADITAVDRAFAYSAKHGVLNVVATGNSGEDLADKPHIPLAAYEEKDGPLKTRSKALLAEVPGTLRVGEATPNGQVMPTSTSGLGIVDLSSVGSGRLASWPGTYTEDAGNSFAAPAVAGTAALIKQLRPSATPAQITSPRSSSAPRRRPRARRPAASSPSSPAAPARTAGPPSSGTGGSTP